MKQADPILEALTAPGAPFELTRDSGVPRFAHAPRHLAALLDRCRTHGERTCFVEGDARLTYAEVFQRSDALAGTLGIAPGDRVAILMRNSSAWMIGFLAILRAGGVAVLVNSRGAPAELRAAVDECQPTLTLADPAYAAALRESGHAGRILEPADFPAEGAPPASVLAPGLDDPAAILFTSGTTGRVKGAVLSHRNLITGLTLVEMAGAMVLHNIAAQYGIDPQAILAQQPQHASLLVFPLFHISGLASGFLSPMLAGGKIVLMRRWNAEEALKLVAREKITALSGVPTMLWDILNCPALGQYDVSSLTNLSSGGQALPLNLLEAVRRAFPRALLGTGFGLTETSGPIAMAVGEDYIRNRASAGRILPLAEVRVLDEQGHALPPGEAGEIAVRGAMVMTGYWNRPEESARALDADGWFHTGDVGYVDAEGYIFIVDRKKDMVISGGENIYCAEVERVISEIPQVAEGAAFGLPDARLGERLVAVVVADGISEAFVQEHVGATLARYKAPVRVGIADGPLPRNAIGKIDKIQLRAAWAHLSEDI